MSKSAAFSLKTQTQRLGQAKNLPFVNINKKKIQKYLKFPQKAAE